MIDLMRRVVSGIVSVRRTLYAVGIAFARGAAAGDRMGKLSGSERSTRGL